MSDTDLPTAVRSVLSRGRQRVQSILGAPEKPRPSLIDYIAADIVNNCNLRCPFCLVDYDKVHDTQLMAERTFRALVRLAPAVPEGGFWLSCLHEPTLHPRLTEFLGWIPVDQRRKFWFTTNLARPLPDPMIESLARSGLHHINVSLDTFDDQLFAVLRKHGRLKVFRHNLDRLVEQFRRTPGAPALRYITMAFRSNREEIPGLVQWMNESGLAWAIEIRYTFNTWNIAQEFRRDQYLHADDWPLLRAALEALPYTNIVLGEPPEGYADQDPTLSANWFETYTPPPGVTTQPLERPFTTPLQLRARPDGRLLVSGQEHRFVVNVVDLEDPIGYFEELCGKTARR